MLRYCEYKHPSNKEEEDTKAEIRSLKKEINDLKIQNQELVEKLKDIEEAEDNISKEVLKAYPKENYKSDEKNEIKCDYCEFKGKSVRAMKKHNVNAHTSTIETQTEKEEEEKTLQDIIRENSGIKCDHCEFRAKSSKSLKKHKATSHTSTIETQTEKLQPERHKLDVYLPLRFDGRFVGKSRDWYKDNLGYLEEVSSVESVWIHSSSINYNAGDFLKADIEIITEDPWTAQWKSETLRKEILRKVQIEETQIRPEQFVDIAKFNYKEALTDNKEQ